MWNFSYYEVLHKNMLACAAAFTVCPTGGRRSRFFSDCCRLNPSAQFFGVLLPGPESAPVPYRWTKQHRCRLPRSSQPPFRRTSPGARAPFPKSLSQGCAGRRGFLAGCSGCWRRDSIGRNTGTHFGGPRLTRRFKRTPPRPAPTSCQ